MKKIIAVLIAILGIYNISAQAAGESVRYYDASAYINNYPIPCYNINDYCGIFVKDLALYGFTVEYDSESSAVNVTRDNSCTEITGIEDVKLPWQRVGTEYKKAGESGIRVLLDGVETPSFWVDGNMMILLDNLYTYGKMYWESESKTLFLTLEKIPKKEYVPLEKAVRQYSRYKPETWQLDKDSYYAYPADECDWGFVRVEGSEPNLYSWQKSVLEKFDAYYMDHSKPHAVYLTFDEGYEAGYTQQIIDVLTKYNVPAAFFVTGDYLDSSSGLVQQMIDKGFIVGNHTENHKNLARCDIGTVMNEIEIVSNRLKYDFGYETYYMRPPEGAFNERALAVAKDMGYNTMLWSFAYYDYDPNVQKGTDYAYEQMTKYMHDGAIMLIHAVSRDNANALERVIQYGIDNGYEFRSLDDLCNP